MRKKPLRLFTSIVERATSLIRRLVWSAVITSPFLAQEVFAQWQLTDAPGRKLDTDHPIEVTDGYALIGFNNSSVGVYDIATGVLIRNIGLPNGPALETRTFAAGNGRLLVSDSIFAPNAVRGFSRAYSFDIATGRQLAELELQSPTQRLAVGENLATDGERGIVSSIKCVAKCETPDPTLRGVVDVFDIETGKHLMDIVHTNNWNFGHALDIQQNIVAVASRSHNSAEAGNVHLYDLNSEATANTIVPTGDPRSRHDFGSDLAIDAGRLVVADKSFSAPNSVNQGAVSVYEINTGNPVAELDANKIELEGTSNFGFAVDLSGEYIIVGAPANGSKAAASDPPDADREAEGSVVIANITVPDGIFSRPTWSGGDSVAIAGDYALVQSVSEDNASVYSISLVGLLPGIRALSAATLQTQGDLDGDGNVSFGDFLRFAENYGTEVDGVGNGDLNSNGIVDFPDFLILQENYGGAVASQSIPVPEPEFGWPFVFGIAVTLTNFLRTRRNV